MRFSRLTATALSTTLIGLVPSVAAGQNSDLFDWSGFYVGGTAGIVTQKNTATATYPDGVQSPTSGFIFIGNDLYLDDEIAPEDTGLPTSFALSGSGPSFGVTAGFNVQRDKFVYGIEGDFSVLGQGALATTEISAGGRTSVSVTTELHNLATARGRVGIVADRVLLFATAGIAAGQTSLSTEFDFADEGKSAAASGSASGLGLGYVAGLGAEYAANENVSLKAEALYYSLQGPTAEASGSGTGSGEGLGTPVALSPYSVAGQYSGLVVRTGVNFRF